MTTKSEFELVDEQAAELEHKSEAMELSLSDLDMVGGGTMGIVFG